MRSSGSDRQETGSERLDQALVRRGLAPSRERAQAAVKAGLAQVNGRVVTRSAQSVSADDRLEVTGDPIGYVGRGGLKLEAALDRFGLDPREMVCLDAGASTGGFTDCLLQRGARHVYAVDVGRDQLHPTLRSNPRVTVMEGTDIRTLTGLPELPALVTGDLSFISLTLVIPSLSRIAAPGAHLLLLVKPQFEVGPGRVGRGGVVRNPAFRAEAVDRVLRAAEAEGLLSRSVFPSPVLGGDGNQEYLALFRKSPIE